MTFTLLVPVKRHRKLNTALFEAPHLQKIQLDFSRTVFLQRVKDVCGGQRTRSQPSSPPPPRSPQEAWRGLTEHVLQTDQAGHKVVKVDGEVLLAIASHDGLMQRVVQAEAYAAGSNGQRSGGLRRDEWGTNAPYGNFILHLTSFLHGHPHLSGAHGPRVVHIPLAVDALWEKRSRRSRQRPSEADGGSSETHQEVLDLGPQHLELHQAQFVAAVFLWHQFRSRRLLTFTPSPLNRKSH